MAGGVFLLPARLDDGVPPKRWEGQWEVQWEGPVKKVLSFSLLHPYNVFL